MGGKGKRARIGKRATRDAEPIDHARERTHHVGHEGDEDEEREHAPGHGRLAEDGVGGVDHGLAQVVGVSRPGEEPRGDEPCLVVVMRGLVLERWSVG